MLQDREGGGGDCQTTREEEVTEKWGD